VVALTPLCCRVGGHKARPYSYCVDRVAFAGSANARYSPE